MKTFLLALFFALIANAAQAQLTLCNRMTAPVLAAAAVENGNKLQIVGWTEIAPNACARVAHNKSHAYAYYAFQPSSTAVWEGEEEDEDFCVNMDRNFRIDYTGVDPEYFDADEFDCPRGAEKRRFTILENEVKTRHTIDLE